MFMQFISCLIHNLLQNVNKIYGKYFLDSKNYN